MEAKKVIFPLFPQQKLEAKLTGNKLSEAKQSKRNEKLLNQENAEGHFILVSVPIYRCIGWYINETVSTYPCTIDPAKIYVSLYCTRTNPTLISEGCKYKIYLQS